MNSWPLYSLMLIVIVSVSVNSLVTIKQLQAQQTINMTQSTNVSDSIQAQNDNVSLIASVINITNHTNPIGASVQQMIEATSISNTTVEPSTSNTTAEINWGELCRNPLVDPLISEPCVALTSPDGYTLTTEGERVLKCIGGGALATLLNRPELLELGKSLECGNTASP